MNMGPPAQQPEQKSKTGLRYRLRDLEPEDLNFVLNAWLKSYARFCNIRPRYFEIYEASIKRLLSTGCRCLVACSARDPNLIFGFAVADLRFHLLHYVFVKQALRRNGIATTLVDSFFPEGIIGCTHKTGAFNSGRLVYVGFNNSERS